MGKQYDMTFQLDARLSGGYSSAFKSAQSAMQQYREEYVRVSGELKNVAGYEKQEQAVENTKNKLALLQQQYDNIQREMDETGSHSSDLQNKLLDKQAQIDKTTAALQSQMEKLDDYRKKLQEAGVNTDDLKNESSRLKTEMDELRKKIDEGGDGVEKFTSDVSSLNNAITALGLTKLLQKAYAAFKECTGAATEFEYAMAGVKRTVGGDDDFLSDLGDSFKEMSTTIPITTSELGTIAETAGQLGIAQELVEEFTLVMAELGTTTDLAADEAATMLAQFANITGTTDYERLGSVVAALGDATATTASKVVEMSLGMAASASIAGMSERDILAIAAAVGSLGIESAAGSTAMSQLISTLYKATETGEKLEEIAAISGMSAEEFTTAWGTDAVGAMNTFIQGLTDVERNGKSAIVLLDELGINNVRQVKAILSLAQAGGLLSITIEQANAAWDENTALGDKASVMYNTTQAKLIMLQNEYNNAKVAVGDVFLPALNKLYEKLGSLLSSFTTFVQEHPNVVKAIMAIIAALAAFVAIVVAAKVAMLALQAVLSTNVIALAAAAVVAVVAAIATWVASSKEATEEEKKLSYASQQQADHIAELTEQYEALCEAQQETSTEAQLLKQEIEDCTEAFEDSKQTYEEFIESINDTVDAYNEQQDKATEKLNQLDMEREGTMNLITTLQELTSEEYKNGEAKEKISAIIEILNDRVSGLNLRYNELTGTTNITPESIRAAAEASYQSERKSTLDEQLMAAYQSQETLKAAYEQASAQYDADYNAYQSANSSYQVQHFLKGVLADSSERDAAKEVMDTSKAAYDAAKSAYDQNEALIDQYATEIAALLNSSSEYSEATGEIDAITDSMIDRLEELGDAYAELKETAYDSMTKQYELWSKADEVEKISAESLLAAQEGQRDYWLNYNANLQSLYNRNIEGLDEVVAALINSGADNAQIVNVIAGLAEASDEEVLNFISTWKENEAARNEASESIGKLAVDYDNAVQEIHDTATEAIENLELGPTAAEKGVETIQAFIDGAVDMLPEVSAAFRLVGDAALEQLWAYIPKGGTGGASTTYRAGNKATVSAYAVGTRSASEGWHLTGENGPELMYFYGGERVFTASETRDMLREYQAATTGAYLAEPIEAASAQSYGGVTVHFAPVYDISGTNDAEELRQVLATHDEQLLQQLWELLTEERENAQRRAYR